MKCCECGAEINHVLVNHFDHDGTDRLHVMEFGRVKKHGVVGFTIPERR